MIEQRVYSVSKLTKEIKSLLEKNYPFVWVTGEVSNLSIPTSGHFYFTLKDPNAQIAAVMFRGQNRQLKFALTEGMQVTGLGRLSLYELRGSYQIIFEILEPKGIGALQIAFEQLKARLSAEGLFDESRKRAIPFLPNRIALITSPTGAVVHDMLQILLRRFPGVNIAILPVKVQGDSAVTEIVEALNDLRELPDIDVAIIARGGGSIEDLHAFNDELVARAIYTAPVPIISAIGHETDFTIADFVADLRAPTPSAAAELIIPLKDELIRRVQSLSLQIASNFKQLLSTYRLLIQHSETRLIDPRKKAQEYRIRLDEWVGRLYRSLTHQQKRDREHLAWLNHRLNANIPIHRLSMMREKLKKINENLLYSFKLFHAGKSQRLSELAATLNAISPLAILSRGYSITRTVPDGIVIRESKRVEVDQPLEILLNSGSLLVSVLKKNG
jgi:exodeoxyribonuclease VII large subunit